MRAARFQELDRLIAKEPKMSVLAERVMHNAHQRDGNTGKRGARPGGHSGSLFSRSMGETWTHPLDRKFRCGFDPKGVSTKQYRVHISNCHHADCIDRHMGWLDLMEYFRTRNGF
jgi:hypothetical protein